MTKPRLTAAALIIAPGILLFWLGYMNLFERPFNSFYFIVMLVGLASVSAGLIGTIWLTPHKKTIKTKITLFVVTLLVIILLLAPLIYEMFFVTRIIM